MEPIDIAIVGSGIACTTTVIEIFRRLINGVVAPKKLSIVIIEKHHEFWLGIPYGSRSSPNALTITSIADFFTAEKERIAFFKWFDKHGDELLEWYATNGGLGAGQWLKRNTAAIKKEDWKNVYMPRFMFGRYIKSILDDLLKEVEDKQLACVSLINAEVVDADNCNEGYEITLEKVNKTRQKLKVAKLVIATGSAPMRDILPALAENDNVTFIGDLYNPSAIANIEKLAEALSATKNVTERNVLLLGSNASSIELLYLLSALPDVVEKINKLVVVSRSGLYPYHILSKTLENYPCDHLDQIKASGNYNITQLVDAAMKDIKHAVKDGVIVPHIDKIIGYTLELLQPLGEQARKEFLAIYGMQLSNQFRRSGGDYKGGEAFLTEMQKLQMLKGAFEHIAITENGAILSYTDTGSGELKKCETPFKVVINCTGSDYLDRSGSKLLYNLIHRGIAVANLSGKGFYVNEKFEAAPGLYIMGPLLGGNMNERIHFWHLENASRLMYLAPLLAEELVG